MHSQISTFSSTVQKSEGWIKEIHEELNWMTSDQVYHVLRAVLQTLRDHLSTNEAAQFAAQLPLLLRGIFFESWDPKTVPEKRATIDSFFPWYSQKWRRLITQTLMSSRP